MNRFILVPVGGLANRMRAVASAAALTHDCGFPLSVIWFKDWALNACFHSLFQMPEGIGDITITEAVWTDHLLYDRPRRKNLFVPFIFQKMLFDRALDERQTTALCSKGYDFYNLSKNKRIYMASYSDICKYSHELLCKLFRPHKEIEEIVDNNVQLFSNNTIGLHIRRTDHAAAIRRSPLDLFIKAIDEEAKKDPQTCIYLATDSDSVKKDITEHCNGKGIRVICSRDKADRNTVNGIKGGVADMFTLARTDKIYGSFQSSFSELAAQLGNVPLEILKLSE